MPLTDESKSRLLNEALSTIGLPARVPDRLAAFEYAINALMEWLSDKVTADESSR